MLHLIKSGETSLLCGLNWLPIESFEEAQKEVSLAVKKRKDDVSEGVAHSLLSGCYTTSRTNFGTFAAGILPEDKSLKLPKVAYSLAGLCAKYAQEKRSVDSIFAWHVNDELICLIAIRNGLPIFDAVLKKDELRGELDYLLPSFESGSSAYGDPTALPPPVALLSIDDIATMISDGEKIIRSGPSDLVQVAVLLTVVLMMAGGGWYWWSDKQAQEEAARAEAERASLQSLQASPQKLFDDAQNAAMAGITGCQSITPMSSLILSEKAAVKGYSLKSITGKCTTGEVIGSYVSTSLESDLSVKSADPRMMITEQLNNAELKTGISPSPVKINVADLKKWQEWLVINGANKQEMSRVGVDVQFTAVTPSFVPTVLVPDGASVVVQGKIAVSGRAQYLVDASKRFSNVAWQDVSIVMVNGSYIFNLNGDYYAIKD